jgi:Ca-activated chloride channel family protein
MRKTVSSVLLGLSLLSPACHSASQEAPERVALARNMAQASNAPSDPRGLAADPAPAPEPAKLAETTTAANGHAAQGSGAYPMALEQQDRAKAGRTGGDVTSGEAYRDWGKNPWVDAAKDHLSTFAADVDTASYTIARRKLNEGALPPPAAVRVEEFVNYFRYTFPSPATDSPFAVVMDAAPSPLSPGRHILRVGVATKALSQNERKPAHLVFLVDVSGSMASPDKLALAQQSLRILTNNLKDGDTVALVTYAGSSRVVLPPTGLAHRDAILSAIEGLTVGGSTAMGSGIDLAYQQAMQGLVPGAISRVIVCTDGDANVGSHTHDEILKLIAGRAKEGVTLSTIGFGMGNYKDELMEQLADKGNGNNFYIDSLAAAKKVFQDQLGSTLEVVAKDVKLQVDFDPALVARYRLVGYENRDVKDDDFRNDKVDAGEVGAGHQVTALYEIELTDKAKLSNAPLGGVRIRHKQPRGEKATEAAFPMVGGAAAGFASAPSDLRFAFAVAAFADVLRNGQDAEHWSLPQIRDLAKAAAGDDTDRKELVGLIDRAIKLRSPDRHASR